MPLVSNVHVVQPFREQHAASQLASDLARGSALRPEHAPPDMLTEKKAGAVLGVHTAAFAAEPNASAAKTSAAMVSDPMLASVRAPAGSESAHVLKLCGSFTTRGSCPPPSCIWTAVPAARSVHPPPLSSRTTFSPAPSRAIPASPRLARLSAVMKSLPPCRTKAESLRLVSLGSSASIPPTTIVSYVCSTSSCASTSSVSSVSPNGVGA